jgi:hypothetical protein
MLLNSQGIPLKYRLSENAHPIGSGVNLQLQLIVVMQLTSKLYSQNAS